MATTGTQTFTEDNNTDIDTLGWTTDNGDFQVLSNQARAITSGAHNRGRYTDTQLDSADHYAQCVVDDYFGGMDGGPTVRQASSTHTNYGIDFLGAAGGTIRLRKTEAGDETELDSAAGVGGGPKTLKIEVDGATQVVTEGETTHCSDTDSDIEAGQYAGVWAWADGTLYDDWIAADLGAPAAAAPTAVLDGPLVGPLGGPV